MNTYENSPIVSFTDAGSEIWTYRHARATPQARNFIPFARLVSSAADVKTKELVIMFNKNDVVSKYTMRETEEVVKKWARSLAQVNKVVTSNALEIPFRFMIFPPE